MKIFSLTAAVLISLTAPQAGAGTLTMDSGLHFIRPASFTNNSIEAEVVQPIGVMGDLVRLFDDSTISRGPVFPRIAVGGSYDANAGDFFSIAYDFTVDLDSATPIVLTLGAKSFDAVPIFKTLITLTPGVGHYQGTLSSPFVFGSPTSGTWKGRLSFDFGVTDSTLGGSPASLDLSIEQIDFQLAPTAAAVPEPSSLVFLGLGLGALFLLARRRRLA